MQCRETVVGRPGIQRIRSWHGEGGDIWDSFLHCSHQFRQLARRMALLSCWCSTRAITAMWRRSQRTISRCSKAQMSRTCASGLGMYVYFCINVNDCGICRTRSLPPHSRCVSCWSSRTRRWPPNSPTLSTGSTAPTLMPPSTLAMRNRAAAARHRLWTISGLWIVRPATWSNFEVEYGMEFDNLLTFVNEFSNYQTFLSHLTWRYKISHLQLFLHLSRIRLPILFSNSHHFAVPPNKCLFS